MSRSAPARPRHLRGIAALAAIALALLAVAAGTAPAQAAGTVSGRLVDQLGDPVLGLEFIAYGGPSDQVHIVSDPTDGTFSVPLTGSSYYLIIGENPITGTYTDSSGNHYENNGNVSFFLPSSTALGDIVVNKFVQISGTIPNWAADMGPVRVDFYGDAGGSWHSLGNGGTYGTESTDGSFSFLAPVSAGDYTLRFFPEGPGAYLGAFLGGEFDDPALATHLVGVPGVGFSGIQMTMPVAALITGRVTTGGTTPLAGINVSAQNEPDETEYDETLTDSNGQYSLRVRPGSTNSVYAYDPSNTYAAMTYNGRSGCGCDFDPVVSTVATPATGIDFDLVPSDAAKVLEGLLVDESSSGPVGDIEVKLYRASGTGWILADQTTSDTLGPPNFGFQLSGPGVFRLQFVNSGGRILTVTQGLLIVGSGDPAPLDPVPACFANLGDLQDDAAVIAQVDSATAAGACAPLPAPSGGSGSTPVVIHRHHSAPPVTGSFPLVVPTPTPSASPSETPEPSASPTPVADGHHITPPAAPDLWWLLWLGLGILLVIIVGGGIFLFRRA